MEEIFNFTSNNPPIDNENLHFSNSVISDDEDPIWLIILDRSQLIMTIVGLIANVGTSTTLIKNGQVGMATIGVKSFIL